MVAEDHEFSEEEDENIVAAAKATGTADEALMAMLKDLRKKEAKKHNVLYVCGFPRSIFGRYGTKISNFY